MLHGNGKVLTLSILGVNSKEGFSQPGHLLSLSSTYLLYICCFVGVHLIFCLILAFAAVSLLILVLVCVCISALWECETFYPHVLAIP